MSDNEKIYLNYDARKSFVPRRDLWRTLVPRRMWRAQPCTALSPLSDADAPNNIFGNGFALFLQLFQFVNRMCDASVSIKYSSPQFGGIRVFIQWKMLLHLLRSNQSTAPDALVLMHSSPCNNDPVSAPSSWPPSARCSQQYRHIKIHIYGDVNEQRNANDAGEAL